MNHMNIFNPYRDRAVTHEDELTRNFLLLVKHIPVVSTLFLEMVRAEMMQQGENSIPSSALGELTIKEVLTQIGNSNSIFDSPELEGNQLLSIVISDDRLEQTTQVKNAQRKARYDGVFLFEEPFVFILENKPSKNNIWLGQLDPNVQAEKDIRIIPQPCCLSWRDMIARLGDLLAKQIARGLEYNMIDDFIEYIDAAYPELRPYTSFAICNNLEYPLKKRMQAALSSLCVDGKQGKLEYHKGWYHFIDSGKNTVRKIALSLEMDKDCPASWSVRTPLYAGDTMTSAKETYKKLDIEALLALTQHGFTITPNFHFSFASSNLLWFDGEQSTEEYLRYWKENYSTLAQVPRANFGDYFEKLIRDKVISEQDRAGIKEKITNKEYSKINVCPGFQIAYCWSAHEAKQLDNEKKFVSSLAETIARAFAPFGGINITLQ